MKTSRIVLFILWLFIIGPIWWYLLYKILQKIEATELMWFLFYVYVPAAIVAGCIGHLTKKDDENA